jgi:hypothetical protein
MLRFRHPIRIQEPYGTWKSIHSRHSYTDQVAIYVLPIAQS